MFTRIILFPLFLGGALWGGCQSNTRKQASDPKNVSPNHELTLVWSDEFDYEGRPDTARWDYDTGGHGWGNNELQFYTSDPANAFVKDGKLYITVRKEPHENRSYTSARLVTRGKASWQYGKIEVRAKLPAGRGLWPAIWMLGDNISQVGWPACGEIDIMEHVGFEPDSIFGTIHTEAFNHVRRTHKGGKTFIHNPYNQFHTYAVEWTPEKMDFLLDGRSYFTVPNTYQTTDEWPFNQPFHLILNIAVGGNFGGMKGLDESITNAAMEVDWVRVYQ